MAGVKGKSGGARPNSGGKRAGAGRKPKGAAAKSANPKPAGPPAKTPSAGARKDPLAFLEDVVNDAKAPLKDRIRAAVAAAQYRHTKLHDGGKKDATADKAKGATAGRFSTPGAPPRLAVAGGKRVV